MFLTTKNPSYLQRVVEENKYGLFREVQHNKRQNLKMHYVKAPLVRFSIHWYI